MAGTTGWKESGRSQKPHRTENDDKITNRETFIKAGGGGIGEIKEEDIR